MAQSDPITRLGGWAGYHVVEDWQEQRAGQSWCVLRLQAVAGWLRQCSQCGQSTRSVHDQQDRKVRDLPIFQHRVELIVPRLRVACPTCGPKLERLSWLEPYARVTQRMGQSVAQLCKVASIRHVANYFDLDWKTVKELDFANLQRELGITILYVTHDQEIALAIADRIAVMDGTGQVRQIAPPEDAYERPADAFVFRFLGVANFLPVQRADGEWRVGDGSARWRRTSKPDLRGRRTSSR